MGGGLICSEISGRILHRWRRYRLWPGWSPWPSMFTKRPARDESWPWPPCSWTTPPSRPDSCWSMWPRRPDRDPHRSLLLLGTDMARWSGCFWTIIKWTPNRPGLSDLTGELSKYGYLLMHGLSERYIYKILIELQKMVNEKKEREYAEGYETYESSAGFSYPDKRTDTQGKLDRLIPWLTNQKRAFPV